MRVETGPLCTSTGIQTQLVNFSSIYEYINKIDKYVFYLM